MNRKRILTYVASALIPTIIFFALAYLIGYLPFKDELLNAYDSFIQYPGILLEYARNLKGGNLFYSFGGALGLNFFGTITYYTFSPLNLLSIFADAINYPHFIATMTYLRFALLGISMCFYLSHKNYKPTHTVIFSTIFALSGFMCTYYYNYIWMDSIIMLPLVIHGLDKLIDEDKSAFYMITLTLTIIINYYIGYMICIFCLLWFIYRVVNLEDKSKRIKQFIISSLLSGAMAAFVILPSMFALMKGKSDLFDTTDYFGTHANATTFLYNLTSGTYQINDQKNGPALIYSSIFVVVLTIYYFYTSAFTKKEKIATSLFILYFYLSFSINALNYSWQFFQRPIWWQSRFSFLFSFLLITIAAKTLPNLNKTKMRLRSRIIITVLFVLGVLFGAHIRLDSSSRIFTFIYLGLSLMIFIEMMFLLDKKGFLVMLTIFTFAEVSCNTMNSLKSNIRNNEISYYASLKEKVSKTITELDKKNGFYRFELKNSYTSTDGMYFGYNGINHFSSVRNRDTIKFLETLGLHIESDCSVELDVLDPLILSLLNIKYIYGQDVKYLNEVDDWLHENPYPLSLWYATKTPDETTLKGLTGAEYRNELMKTLTGLDEDIYTYFDITKFDYALKDRKDTYQLKFKVDADSLFFFEDLGGTVKINDEEYSTNTSPLIVKKGDEVEFTYDIIIYYENEEVYTYLFDIATYEKHMELLSENLSIPDVKTKDHLVEGSVTIGDEFDYLMTSIPYEKGMRVYVDGEEIKSDIALGALVGIPLETGTHDIKIDYVPEGLMLGGGISFLSLITSIVYLQIKKKAL